MKSDQNRVSYEISSPSKVWLSRIFYILVALDVIRLITSSVSADATDISSTVVSLILDGIMLAAILKAWIVVLKIARFVYMVLVVLGVIVIVFGIIEIADNKLDKRERSSEIAYEVVLCFEILCYAVLARLTGRYTTELQNVSYA